MRGMTLLVALILSGCASGPLTHAQAVSPRVPVAIGEETIGEFRSWEHKVQAAYVLGFRSVVVDMAGIVCDRRSTIRETVAALTTRPSFTPEMTVHNALAILLKENGCHPPEENSEEDRA